MRLVLLFLFTIFFIGCGLSQQAKSGLKQLKKTNGEVVSLKTSDPKKLLGKLKDIRAKSPTINILQWGKKEFFKELKYPGFIRLDPLDDETQSKLDGFSLARFKMNLTEKLLPDPDRLNRTVYYNHSLATTKENLFLCDDFYPLKDNERNRFLSDLPEMTFFTDDPSFVRFGQASTIQSLKSTTDSIFSPDSLAGYPMGAEDVTEFLPLAMDAYVLIYNATAWEVAQQLIGLTNEFRPGEKMPGAEVLLEEVSPPDFLSMLLDLDLTFHYPNPFSHNAEIKRGGMAFLFQLLHWLEPKTYKTFLRQPHSPSIGQAMTRVLSYLRTNRSVFKAEDSFEAILNQSRRNNILQNLPANFTLEDSFQYEDLPEDYFLDEQDYRIGFGFLPESFFVQQYTAKSFYLKNETALKAIREKKLEQIKRREERSNRRKKARRGLRPLNQAQTPENDEEAESGEEGEEEGEEDEEEVDLTKITQLTSFIVDKGIARRIYLAIPANGLKKSHALYFANSMLQSDVQKAFTMSPHFLRSIRPELEAEVYITKVSTKKTKKRVAYTMQIFLPQADFKDSFLPILNPFYQAAFESRMRGI